MKIGTSKISSDVDRACVEKLGIPLIVLMENAALKVIKHLETDKYSSYVLICGTGNNGGDGLAAARHLYVLGKKVEVFLVMNSSSKLSQCCEANYNILKNMGVAITKITEESALAKLKSSLLKAEVTVDAIFGTGLNREVEGIYKKTIDAINQCSKYTLSIDIPSGMNGDSGKILGCCIKANRTVCFEFYKRGFLNYNSKDLTSEIIVESIGMPESILKEFHNNEFILEKAYVTNSFKPRSKYGHKGNYGRTLIIAGSEGFSGAAYLATEAAVKSGSGLVTLCCSSSLQHILSSKLEEAMTCSYENTERLMELINTSNGIAIGPGLGNNKTTLELLDLVIENAHCPLIIDADGLNVLSENLNLLKKAKSPIIITPHPGEMSRLTGLTVGQISSSRVDIAKKFALDHNIIVLLKGYETVITDGHKAYINPTGNSSMASGGMGDCLTGIITSFVSQGLSPLDAAACGAYIHGYAGDRLSRDRYCVNAGAVIEEIPYAMKEMLLEK